MRISDWSADVCSSDLGRSGPDLRRDLVERTAEAFDHVVDFLVSDDQRRREGGDLAPVCAQDQARKRVVQGRGVSGRVDLGGRRLIKKIKEQQTIKKQ